MGLKNHFLVEIHTKIFTDEMTGCLRIASKENMLEGSG